MLVNIERSLWHDCIDIYIENFADTSATSRCLPRCLLDVYTYVWIIIDGCHDVTPVAYDHPCPHACVRARVHPCACARVCVCRSCTSVRQMLCVCIGMYVAMSVAVCTDMGL